MAEKNKIKVSTYKNKRGETVSVARVYTASGDLLSEHEAIGENTQQASSEALGRLKNDYKGLEGQSGYDISNASIEHVNSRKPIVPSKNGPAAQSVDNNEPPPGSQNVADMFSFPDPSQVFVPPEESLDQGPPISQREAELLEEISSATPSGFTKIVNGNKHVDWPEYDSDNINGIGHKALSEPVPKFFARPGDGVLTAAGFDNVGGRNNNAWIVLGRDRNGIGEFERTNMKRSQSGHSDKMGAGAIDIVVGRMAPFPMQGISTSPQFLTKNILELKGKTLNGEIPPGFTAPHGGVTMDAARIYISQMTDMDHNFDISRKMGPFSDTETKVASSGIMIKADRVRMHARNDVKIVTGGQKEKYNSMGSRNLSLGGIHLMAGNGALDAQQPIPKGHNLKKAFEDLLAHHNDFVDLVFGFVKTQMEYNQVLATHFHQSPAMGASTTPSVTGWALGVESSVSHFVNFGIEIPKHKYNADAFRKKFLSSGEDDYINSKYNTTN